MIPRGVEIFVGLEPIDLRWGFDRLSGVVDERLGRGVRSGALFVFFGKRHHSIKMFFFDGSGLCIIYKRLDKGTFRLPLPLNENDPHVIIDDRVLDDLIDGLALTTKSPKVRRMRVH